MSEKPVNYSHLYKLAIFSFNSTIIYLLAFFITFIAQTLITQMAAELSHIKTVYDHFILIFKINNTSSLWTVDSIIFIFASGPFLCLVIGLISLRVHRLLESSKDYLSLFLLWLYILSFNRFFGAFISGVVTHKGFGYVLNWIYLPFNAQVLFAAGFLVALMLIGYFTNRYFLHISFSQTLIATWHWQMVYKFAVAIVPILISYVFLWFFDFFKDSIYEMVLQLCILMTVAPIFRHYSYRKLSVYKKIIYPAWSYIIIFVLVFCWFYLFTML